MVNWSLNILRLKFSRYLGRVRLGYSGKRIYSGAPAGIYSGYSAPGSRIAGMEIQVFRNENSSQTNAYSHYSNYSYSELIPNERALTGVTEGVFHLPRDSGNSGWVVNGTWFFGLFHWKISGKNGTFEKVVPFSRWKFSDGTPCSIYGFRKGFYQFQAALGHRNMAATPNVSLRSWPAMNHTNAKTCLSRGIRGLPNACCWGTLPVAFTSRHRGSRVLLVILKWL